MGKTKILLGFNIFFFLTDLESGVKIIFLYSMANL
jgi:hypothetical protein